MLKNNPYNFRLQVENSFGLSDRGTISVLKTAEKGTEPDLPEAKFVLSTGGMIKIDWDPPVDEGGEAVDKYWVFAREVPEYSVPLAPDSDGWFQKLVAIKDKGPFEYDITL
jgi:hypothetical protein